MTRDRFDGEISFQIRADAWRLINSSDWWKLHPQWHELFARAEVERRRTHHVMKPTVPAACGRSLLRHLLDVAEEPGRLTAAEQWSILQAAAILRATLDGDPE